MIDEAQLDSLAYLQRRYPSAAPRFAFDGGDPVAWRTKARSRLVELLALPDGPKVPLDPKWGEPKSRIGHTRRPVTFATREGLHAFGYLLVPEAAKKPPGVVICLPGHGRGADDIVGIAEDGTDRDHDDGYQHDFAVQCVRNGYAALALEMIGFGHRRDAKSRAAGGSVSSCQNTSGAALLLGECMVGWRVWDTLRAIDLLETVPEVDAKRVAVMGISGGGTVGLYAAAVDERIRAAVLSCSFCTFKDSIYSISHCIDNFVPGLLRDFEAADIASLIAPRVLIAENGLDDPIFPEPGAIAAREATRKSFAASGAEANFTHAFFPAGHVFHGLEAFARLRQVL